MFCLISRGSGGKYVCAHLQNDEANVASFFKTWGQEGIEAFVPPSRAGW